MKVDKLLSGRTAVVTGGASGIGKAIALALAEVGADVAIGSRSAATNSCKAEIEVHGVRALALTLDLRSLQSVQDFSDAVLQEFSKIDILVNSAGIAVEQPICGHSEQKWQEIMDVNLNGVYRTISTFLPGMISRQWGRIINIASTAASVGSATNPAYCASKAAVVALTRCVALEGAPHGVSCNAISPGWVETDFGKNWMAELAETSGESLEDYMNAIQQANPQKRMIQPQEIGALAVFLCRDEAFGITMQDITVSAGSLW